MLEVRLSATQKAKRVRLVTTLLLLLERTLQNGVKHIHSRLQSLCITVTPLTVPLSQLFKYCFNDVSFTEAQKKYE